MLDYYPGSTFLHRLDVRTKCAMFGLLTGLLFLFSSPLYLLGIGLALTVPLLGLRIPRRRVGRLLMPVAPVLTFVVLFAGFTNPAERFSGEWAGRVLFYAWPGEHLPYSVGGLLLGLTFLLRMVSMILLTSLLTFTTPLDDFILLMRSLRFPQPLVFVIATGIRFVPAMQKKAEQVFEAQRSRGAGPGAGGVFKRLFAYLPIMVPLLVDSIRMSDRLAIAMLNRGYGATKRPTPLKILRMQTLDYVLLALSAAVFAALVYLRSRGYGTL